MGIHSWPYCVDFELDNGGVPRPDGPVSLRINGTKLLQAVKSNGHLDFGSLRVTDLNLFRHEWGNKSVERDVAVQFVPDAHFDPLKNPMGTLWFHLYKYPWEDSAFPRQFRLYFDSVNGGGRQLWTGLKEPSAAPLRMMEIVPGRLELWRGDRLALAFNAPWNTKPGFHPVTSPRGQVLTADRPRDHSWHHGLCFGWTSVACDAKKLRPYTFWGEPGGGCRHTESFTRKSSGPVLAGFESCSICCTQEGEPVFDLRIAARYQPVDIGWDWLDVDLTISAREDTVEFRSDYGHFFARLSLEFRNSTILDSEGNESRDGGAMPVDWIGFSGDLHDGPASILLLNHPDNPGDRPSGDANLMQRTEAMDRGNLFATINLNPFRQKPFILQAGKSATWKYRVVTTDRLLDVEFALQHYNHWITPWTIHGTTEPSPSLAP